MKVICPGKVLSGQNRGRKELQKMCKRGENIRKRKDGRWEARILCKCAYGTSNYRSVYGKSYREVKEKKENFIREQFQKESLPGVTKINSEKKYQVTFEDVLFMWLENRAFHQKKSTRLKYNNMIKLHIIPALGNIEIEQMDDVLVNQFLISKKENGRLDGKGGLSNSYIKTMAIIISSSLDYAIERELRNPMKCKIQKPAVLKKEITILSQSMQQIYEDRLDGVTSTTELAILIALHTGMRIGEICALKWEDIDYENRLIRVRHSIVRIENEENEEKKTKLVLDTPKTKTSIRDIPIYTKLYQILLPVKEKTSNYFVASGCLNFISPRTFEYRFHQVLKKYELEDINFHVLRHTFATRCVEYGVDVKTLSEVLGHSNVNITLNTYIHSSLERKRGQLEKLSAV